MRAMSECASVMSSMVTFQIPGMCVGGLKHDLKLNGCALGKKQNRKQMHTSDHLKSYIPEPVSS